MYVIPEGLLRSSDPPSRCDAACRKPCGDGDFQGFLERARPNTSPTDEASGLDQRRKEEEAAEAGVAAAAIHHVTQPAIRPVDAEPTTAPATTCLPSLPDHCPPSLEANSDSSAKSAGGVTWEIQESAVDRMPFLQRVLRVSAAAGTGSQTIRMRLCPPELGPLRLEIRLQDGAMNAQLEVETPAARELLLENLPLLEERLRQQDVRLERFDVDLMKHFPDGRSDQASQQSPRQRRRRDFRAPRPRATRLPQPTLRRSRLQASDTSRIDVTI